MSNLLVQKEIVKRNLQKVLILEDDAYLNLKQLIVFKKAIRELPANWELFYLGCTPLSNWSEHPIKRLLLRLKIFIKPRNVQGMSSDIRQKQFLSTSFSRHLNKPGIYLGTHAYALSYEGAKKIVAIDTPLQIGGDILLMHVNYHKLVNSYSLKKPLFIPNPNFETSLIN